MKKFWGEYKNLSSWSICCRMIVEILILKLLIGFVTNFFNETGSMPVDYAEEVYKMGLINVAVLPPIIETFLYQFLVVEIVLLFTKKTIIAVLLSAIVFYGVHLFNTPYYAVSIIPPAIYYAVVYTFLRNRESRRIAFYVVMFCHMSLNFVVYYILSYDLVRL